MSFMKHLQKMEVQRILKHLRECGVKTITCYGKEYELTNDFIKSIKGVC